MKKKLLLGIILISLLISLVVMFGRIRLETTSPDVEIVLDYPSFQQLQAKVKIPEEQLLAKFKEAGITSVAIYEKQLDYFIRHDELIAVSGAQIMQDYYLTGELDPLFADLFSDSTTADHLFLLFTEFSTYEKLAVLLRKTPGLVVTANEDNLRNLYLLKIEGGETAVRNQYLGFSDEEVTQINEAGLKLVLRVSNNKERLAILSKILTNVESSGEISQIIFSGGLVIGYPDRLDTTAKILKEHGIRVGMVEPFLGYQLGIRELAPLIDLDITRVHSFQQKEMEKYSLNKVLDRYLRAVRERNARVLYYRPFLEAKDEVAPLDLNLLLLEDLQTELKASGYRLGIAEPFSNQRSTPLLIILISAGVFAAGLLLLQRFIRLPYWLEYGLLGLAILLIAAMTLKGYVILSRDVLALLAAVIFPSLAIIIGYDDTAFLNKENRIRKALLIFLKVSGITLGGVLIIIGLLSDVRYLYQINQFRGIKVTFILPILIIGLYYLKRYYQINKMPDLIRAFKDIYLKLNQPVRYIHLALAGLVGIIGLIYIGRTGNFPTLPVTQLEVNIREFLEDLLRYRPRFKEFAIGHPLLILAFYYLLKGKKRLVLPLLLAGSIGQLTIINTFSHIHTPALVSLMRVISALVIGVAVGLILIWLYELLIKYWERLRRWVYD